MSTELKQQEQLNTTETIQGERTIQSKAKRTSTPKESFKSGLALSIAFLIMSVFVYFNPSYLGNATISVIVSVILGGIGVAGLSVELDKLGGKDSSFGISNLGIGLLIGSVWALLYYYFPLWWLNIITSFILLLSLYAISLGLINTFEIIFTKSASIKIGLIKIVIAIAQIVAFTAALLQVMQILKIVP
jgi:hypothetical protein